MEGEDDVFLPHASATALKDEEQNASTAPAENVAFDKGTMKLEDLFNGDDEEFPVPSSKGSNIGNSPPDTSTYVDRSSRNKLEIINYDSRQPTIAPFQLDAQAMYAFYQRLFPFRYLFQWLNHGMKPSPDFGNREFAFTLQNDAYLRYQAFPTADLYVPVAFFSGIKVRTQLGS